MFAVEKPGEKDGGEGDDLDDPREQLADGKLGFTVLPTMLKLLKNLLGKLFQAGRAGGCRLRLLVRSSVGCGRAALRQHLH